MRCYTINASRIPHARPTTESWAILQRLNARSHVCVRVWHALQQATLLLCVLVFCVTLCLFICCFLSHNHFTALQQHQLRILSLFFNVTHTHTHTHTHKHTHTTHTHTLTHIHKHTHTDFSLFLATTDHCFGRWIENSFLL
jgi:hypothetical protein